MTTVAAEPPLLFSLFTSTTTNNNNNSMQQQPLKARFSVRKHVIRRDSSNNNRQREDVCSKQGFQIDEDLCEVKKVNKLETRTGCKALIRFTVTNDASGSDSDSKKSRNQRKREARLPVRWGMQLAAFSTPQIKRILKVISLEDDVLEALMLVKRLGPDVKEGKRRQFNYI
ncbi:hypothetical protein Dsin_003725, partial [Dipteronia sinensis]